MKLIHLTEYKNKGCIYKSEPMRLQCASGMAMSQCMHRIQTFCHEGNKAKSNSNVIWDTNHHEIVLWFEDEKYRTYFSLSLERMGA